MHLELNSAKRIAVVFKGYKATFIYSTEIDISRMSILIIKSIETKKIVKLVAKDIDYNAVYIKPSDLINEIVHLITNNHS